jgi:nucleotide-binding universal stress UspA family protein
MLCAVADDDRLHDVVATGRALAATRRLQPVYVHVGRPAGPVPTPVGFGVRTGTAATALGHPNAAEPGREAGPRLFEEAGIWDEEAIVTTGDPVTELNRLARERAAALIVAGTHGRGLIAGTLLGSVSRGLARDGVCPVVLARDDAPPCLGGPVVCALNPAEPRHAGTARHAARLACWTDRPLVLVHVMAMEHVVGAAGPVPAPVPMPPGPRDQERARERLEELAAGLPVDDVECVVLEPAPIAARLDAFARGRRADLLVAGSRGSGLLRTALEGSVSLDLLQLASRPLALVPAGAA